MIELLVSMEKRRKETVRRGYDDRKLAVMCRYRPKSSKIKTKQTCSNRKTKFQWKYGISKLSMNNTYNDEPVIMYG